VSPIYLATSTQTDRDTFMYSSYIHIHEWANTRIHNKMHMHMRTSKQRNKQTYKHTYTCRPKMIQPFVPCTVYKSSLRTNNTWISRPIRSWQYMTTYLGCLGKSGQLLYTIASYKLLGHMIYLCCFDKTGTIRYVSVPH
jgi:hypothetical protein